MNKCVFCQIIEGKSPCYKVYETKEIIGFLDINPFVKGHTLVVPKKHSNWLWDMGLEEYIILEKEAYNLAKTLEKIFATDWIEEVVAGIGVQHTHLHLLPRQRNDGLKEIPNKPLNPKPSPLEMKEIAKKIYEELNR